MKREGRQKEFFATLKRIKTETGKSHGTAIWAAMKELGYENADRERALEREYLDNLHKSAEQREQEKIAVEVAEVSRLRTFEEAVASLPDKAPVSDEIDWIRAHPAMARKSRQRDKMADIVIEAEDILSAPHGQAPSKAAVFQLQHWANCPHEFYKQILGEHKKKSDGEAGGAKAGEVEDDLSEVDRMLRQVSARETSEEEGGE